MIFPTQVTAGESCATPTLIGDGYYMSSTTGLRSDTHFDSSGRNCVRQAPDSRAPDGVFQLVLPALSRVTVTSTASWDLVMNLVAAPAANCGMIGPDGGTIGITCVDGAIRSGNDDTVSYSNGTTSPVTLFLLIDGFHSAALGSFRFLVTTTGLPGGETCDNAIALSAGSYPNQSSSGFVRDHSPGTGCAAWSLPEDRAYRINVPSGQRLTASVAASPGASFDPAINLVTGSCGSVLECVAGANENVGTAPDTAIYDNTGPSAVDVFVVVDTVASQPVSTFTLNLSLGSQGMAGDSCGNPGGGVITASTMRTGQTFTGFANNYTDRLQSSCRYGAGPDRVYVIDVPAGQVLTATASGGTGGADLALSLIDATVDCSVGPCLSGSNALGSTAERVTFSNASGTATRRLNLVVDARLPNPSGTFTLTVDLSPALVGETCSTAGAPITTSRTLTAQSFSGFGNDYSGRGSCSFQSGPDRVYELAIPAGQRALVSGASNLGNISLLAIEGPAANCASAPVTCLGSSDNTGSSGSEALVIDNVSAAVRQVFVVVDLSGSPQPSESFSLTVSYVQPPAGDTCQSPQLITASGTLSGQTTLGFANDIETAPGCSLYRNEAPDRVYAVSLLAGQTLMVTATPTTNPSWDPSVYLLAGPASNCLRTGTVCLEYQDAAGANGAETLIYTAASAGTYFFVVDGFVPTESGNFSLSIAIQ